MIKIVVSNFIAICLAAAEMLGSLYHAQPDAALANVITNCSPACEINKLYPDPTRTFSVMVFCDDAVGTSIGVVLTQLGDVGGGKDWRNHNRFWQEEAWCRDVVNFAWSPDGKTLLVATSSIYGSGSAFALDVANRNARVIHPGPTDDWKKSYCVSTAITKMEGDSFAIEARDACDGTAPAHGREFRFSDLK